MKIVNKAPSKVRILTLFIAAALSASAFAEDTYVFEDSFIQSGHSKIDLSQYTSSELAAGTYSLDIYTNGQWKGRYDMEVKRDSSGKLKVCYTPEMLTRFGLSVSKLNSKLADKEEACESLATWNSEPTVSDTISKDSMRVDINVPQIYVNAGYRGYIDPSLWDKGIPALNIGWTGNIWNTHRSYSDNSTGYLGLNVRGSVAGWTLHHQGNVNWNDKSGAEWNSSQTYLQRPIPAINSIASVGQISGTGEFFDSTTVRGVGLRSDFTMYPDMMNSFKPEVKGVARSNALVTISQSGRIIHQTTVPPGPFSINDFYPTGYGNDLDVSVKESDGSVTNFTVAYNSGAKLLYPGMFKYELLAGKPDSSYYHDKPIVYQGTVEYGFNNFLTGYAGYSGFNGSYDYNAYLAGIGFNTFLGGFSFDVTKASLDGKHGNNDGEMYRAAYSRNFETTNTSISLVGTKYSDEGFYKLSDGLRYNDGGKINSSREKSNVSMSLSQSLPDGFGSVYATGRLIKYWDDDSREKQYQLAYNNSIGFVNYDVSVQRVRNLSANSSSAETRVGLNFSIPMDFNRNHSATITSNTVFDNSHYSGTNTGINGTVGEHHEFTYSASASNGDNKNVALNAGYKSPYAKVGVGYGQGSDYRQTSLNGSGSVVVHSGGVIFTPESGDTLGIVEAKGAKGATLGSTLGSTIDGNGYAVISNLRPYRVNNVAIDPKGSASNVYFNETVKQVAPYAGSVVKIKYDTEVQDDLMFVGKLRDGKPFPFGVSVYNTQGVMIGSVGQGGTVFIKDASSPTGKITWKGGSCSFTMPNENNSEVVCH